MGNNLSSLLAYSSTLYEAPYSPPRPEELESLGRLEITVLFTDVAHTLDALRKAGQLAHDLHTRIRLVIPQVVPYPLPLTSPPVMLDFTERRFRVMAAEQASANESARQQAVEMRVEIFLCRDANEMLDHALRPKSTIVVGGSKRRWLPFFPSAAERLARRLRRDGHEVIFVHRTPNKNMKEEHVYA